MDKLEHYRSLIKKILTEYHQFFSSASPDNVEMLLAFHDPEIRKFTEFAIA